jgi:hypothetical protein
VGSGAEKQFTTIATMAAGSYLDFGVGYGSNQTYLYDSTGLSAVITPVPEPATLALASLATGLFCRFQSRENFRSSSLRVRT